MVRRAPGGSLIKPFQKTRRCVGQLVAARGEGGREALKGERGLCRLVCGEAVRGRARKLWLQLQKGEELDETGGVNRDVELRTREEVTQRLEG